MRTYSTKRTTAETDITLSLNIDGTGKSEIDTGCGFLDHMLTLFAKHNTLSGEEYFNELRKRNIIVRYFSKERIKDYVRITIGSKEQMDALINATDEILKG